MIIIDDASTTQLRVTLILNKPKKVYNFGKSERTKQKLKVFNVTILFMQPGIIFF